MVEWLKKYVLSSNSSTGKKKKKREREKSFDRQVRDLIQLELDVAARQEPGFQPGSQLSEGPEQAPSSLSKPVSWPRKWKYRGGTR
jgi:hypothetical protein